MFTAAQNQNESNEGHSEQVRESRHEPLLASTQVRFPILASRTGERYIKCTPIRCSAPNFTIH
ncbi:hypothetical protein J6590_040316 [Homalodisca vitripennis]|nr:hypothetical protein J6590_040316 [Homalodisca vitripennis]